MPPRLSDDDSRAVDIVLNRPEPMAAGSGDSQAGVYVASTGVQQRVQCVESLLGLLHHIPVGEVPANLIGRTMRHIQRATRAAAINPVAPGQQPAL